MPTQALPFPRPAPRLHAVGTALAASAATAGLGMFGPGVPGLWQLLPPMGLVALLGIWIAGGAGLLACHLAQLTARPRPAPVAGLLPAALVPAAVMPGLGSFALFPVVMIALVMRRERRPLPVLLAMAGAGLQVSALWAGPVAGATGAVFMLLAVILQVARASRPAANDNPRSEPDFAFWALAEPQPYATPMGTRNPPGE